MNAAIASLRSRVTKVLDDGDREALGARLERYARRGDVESSAVRAVSGFANALSSWSGFRRHVFYAKPTDLARRRAYYTASILSATTRRAV